MKSAYVSADRGVPVFGSKGCSLHVQEILRALRRHGIQVELFAASARDPAPADLAGIPVHPVQRASITDRAAREQADVAANDAMLDLLRRSAPFDMVYERYSLWCDAGMRFAQEAGIPGVLEVNAPLIEEQAKYRGLVDPDAAERIARRCFADATVLLAVSHGVADYLAGFPETEGKVHVLPNGVNTSRFDSIESRRVARSGTFTIGFVGTLKPWHGLPDLLDAFDLLCRKGVDAQLLIVGDGPERAAIEERVAAAGWSGRVNLTGTVSTDTIPALLASMDVGVAPYPAAPSFYFSPLKVYEYLAAGLPVVVSRIGELGSLVTHNETGLLYPPGDTMALAHALQQLLDNRASCHRMGIAAQALARREHDWDSRVQTLLQLAGIPSVAIKGVA